LYLLECAKPNAAPQACSQAASGAKCQVSVKSVPIPTLPQCQNQTNLSKSGKPAKFAPAHSLSNNHRTLLPRPVCCAELPFSHQQLNLKNKYGLCPNQIFVIPFSPVSFLRRKESDFIGFRIKSGKTDIFEA